MSDLEREIAFEAMRRGHIVSTAERRRLNLGVPTAETQLVLRNPNRQRPKTTVTIVDEHGQPLSVDNVSSFVEEIEPQVRSDYLSMVPSKPPVPRASPTSAARNDPRIVDKAQMGRDVAKQINDSSESIDKITGFLGKTFGSLFNTIEKGLFSAGRSIATNQLGAVVGKNKHAKETDKYLVKRAKAELEKEEFTDGISTAMKRLESDPIVIHLKKLEQEKNIDALVEQGDLVPVNRKDVVLNMGPPKRIDSYVPGQVITRPLDRKKLLTAPGGIPPTYIANMVKYRLGDGDFNNGELCMDGYCTCDHNKTPFDNNIPDQRVNIQRMGAVEYSKMLADNQLIRMDNS